MWLTISCVQGKRRGVNVYHPHSWKIAKQLCIDILAGIHPNGAARSVYATVFNNSGSVSNATVMRNVYDVETWYHKQYGSGRVVECSSYDGRLYTLRVETAHYIMCCSDIEIDIMVRGEPIKTGSIFTAITHYIEEFKKRFGGF